LKVPVPADVEKLLKQRKAERHSLEQAIDKAIKEAVKPNVAAARLIYDRAQYVSQYDDDVAFAAKGAARAKATMESLLHAQQQHLDFWAAAIKQTSTEGTLRVSLWAERSQIHHDRHLAVLAERDARILAAEALPESATAEITSVDKAGRSTAQEDLSRDSSRLRPTRSPHSPTILGQLYSNSMHLCGTSMLWWVSDRHRL
jgi:hypothetical protein